MKKIATLTCLRSNIVCARASCLKAYNERTDFFAGYGPDTQLAAAMTCNGCEAEQPLHPREDKGIQEKISRLKKEAVSAVHVGACRVTRDGTECPRITEICEMLEEAGITVSRGTHKERTPAAATPEPKR